MLLQEDLFSLDVSVPAKFETLRRSSIFYRNEFIKKSSISHFLLTVAIWRNQHQTWRNEQKML